ncbi:unnamed protein product [Nippostrongylus brasiliensis]|uniref:Protein Shroom1 n=1 Tax=Nippostrongylus brasiliensis TaxID=27835 RepID=A0A158QZZ9_NIPBR|nr:unnamed protein product [Nippostrongylus brasiliensis]
MTGESICWSAPECLNEEDSSDREERLPRSCSCGEVDSAGLEPNTPFLDSYPVIDGGHQVPSLCSIRLPSSSGSVAYSPSPPRPLSPVLGGPPSSALRIPGSRSMQLRPRPELSSFVDNSTSDDDSPQQDPWPQQEVWPEEDVMTRSLRTGWTAADTLSSHTDGYHRSRHNGGGLSTSRSMHSPLRHAPPELESSTRPLLDEVERRDLITRSAWIDRGSSILLQDQEARRMSAKPESWRGFRNGARCESQSDFRCDTASEDSMRRSYTTEELKKERRKLPKRPDMQPFLSELPSSVLHSPVVCEGSECCRDDNGHLARNDEAAKFSRGEYSMNKKMSGRPTELDPNILWSKMETEPYQTIRELSDTLSAPLSSVGIDCLRLTTSWKRVVQLELVAFAHEFSHHSKSHSSLAVCS